MDWAQVNEHLDQLAQPTKVYGEIQFRDEAKDGEALWTFSGRQGFALDEANGDKVRMKTYVADISKKVLELDREPCSWWQRACKRAAKASKP